MVVMPSALFLKVLHSRRFSVLKYTELCSGVLALHLLGAQCHILGPTRRHFSPDFGQLWPRRQQHMVAIDVLKSRARTASISTLANPSGCHPSGCHPTLVVLVEMP